MAMAGRGTINATALSALVFAMLMANASATFFSGGLRCKLFPWKCHQPTVPVIITNPAPQIVHVQSSPPPPPFIIQSPPPPPVVVTCPAAPPPKLITANTCKYANGLPCPECRGKCCVRDGTCAAPDCNKSDQVCSMSQNNYWWSTTANCIGNLNVRCETRCTPHEGCRCTNCIAPIVNGNGRCVPVEPGCPTRTKFCLGTVQCSNPAACGPWHGATCILSDNATTFTVCDCDSARLPDVPTMVQASPPPPRTPGLPHNPRFPRAPSTPDAPRVPRRPRNPRAPSTPDAPRAPRRPRSPRSPRAPSTPDAPSFPKDPNAPRFPKAPNAPSTPKAPDAPARLVMPPPPPANNNQCFYANGTRCHVCRGKCCLEDGNCASCNCNGLVNKPTNFCEWNPHYPGYTHSNCLGDLNLRCGPGSSNCPAAIVHGKGVCVPINHKCPADKFCLGTVVCRGPNCPGWNGAPCIYDGCDKLTWLTFAAEEFRVCSCAPSVTGG